MILKKVTLIAILVTLTIINVSCRKSNGGGFIESAEESGNGKATIGYQIKCDDFVTADPFGYDILVGHITGNIQYNDHLAEVKVHGNIDFIPYVDVAPVPELSTCEKLATTIDGTPPLFINKSNLSAQAY